MSKKNEKVTTIIETANEQTANVEELKAQIAQLREQLKTAKQTRKKSVKDTSARDNANKLANDRAIELGLIVRENENVKNVSKYYTEEEKYIVYMRFGIKSVQVLYKDPAKTPGGMTATTIKYGLPLNLILKYEDFTEQIIDHIFTATTPEQ